MLINAEVVELADALEFTSIKYGDVMELADVADSKSADSDIVWVRLPPSPPIRDTKHFDVWCFFIYKKKK